MKKKNYMKGEIHIGTLDEVVEREEVPKSALDRRLCFTTYSVQGETWDKGRIFINTRGMDSQHLYVAVTRAVNLDQLYFFEGPKVYEVKFIIYMIKSDRLKTMYVGRTRKKVEERFAEHKADPKCTSRLVLGKDPDAYHEIYYEFKLLKRPEDDYTDLDTEAEEIEERCREELARTSEYKMVNKKRNLL